MATDVHLEPLDSAWIGVGLAVSRCVCCGSDALCAAFHVTTAKPAAAALARVSSECKPKAAAALLADKH